jgi:hypothetical protein
MPLNTPPTSSRTRTQLAPGADPRRAARRVLAGLAVAVLAWGCDSGPGQPAPAAPSDRSVRESQPLLLEGLTEGGHYRIRARPALSPVALHQMHDWIVGIELTGPSSEVPTALRFDGGMPAHGHGFVTRPRVTRNLGGGEFLVEGVKFHMPGVWVLQITVVGRTGSDRVTLPLTIDP